MYKPVEKSLVDLFAGCGGLSLGLEDAGFTPLLVSELSSDARASYLVNRVDEHPLLATKYSVPDVKELVAEDTLEALRESFQRDYGVADLDLVVGGPPCQGYSGIGHRRSYSVEKEQLPSNHLYQDMAYIVHVLRPKIFLFENVRGLLSARWTKDGEKGEVWKDVLGTFQDIPGYEVQYELVYAKDYGVPQNRPRVLAVGVRTDLGISPVSGLAAGGFLPEPTQGYPTIEEVLSDIVDDNYEPGGETRTYPSDPKSDLQTALRRRRETGEILRKGDPLTEQEYTKHSDRVVRRFSHMLANDGDIPPSLQTKKFAQRVLPREWSESGPSITVTSLPDDYVHYCQPRSLTVREWARLQTFPDWYRFEGSRTTGGIRRAGNPREGVFEREVPKYTQIGNAVPVQLAARLGHHFRRLIDEREVPQPRRSQTEMYLVGSPGSP